MAKDKAWADVNLCWARMLARYKTLFSRRTGRRIGVSRALAHDLAVGDSAASLWFSGRRYGGKISYQKLALVLTTLENDRDLLPGNIDTQAVWGEAISDHES